MAKYQRFDELPVWQESARLYQRVLDLLEDANPPLTPTFRNQLERAAQAVASSVAESFERMPPPDQMRCLIQARGAAAEVQSLVASVQARPKLVRQKDVLQQIRALAESCARQLGAWIFSTEHSPRGRAGGATNSATRSNELEVTN